MAASEERAERIRDLKAARPDLTWDRIADAIGVKERSAIEWSRTGGITYENCDKLAGLLEVDAEWLWSGRERNPGAGDLMGALSGTSQLDRIEARLNQLAEDLQAMREDAAQGRVRAAGERETLLQLLAEPAQPDAEPPADTPVVSPPRRRATGA